LAENTDYFYIILWLGDKSAQDSCKGTCVKFGVKKKTELETWCV